MRLHYRFSRDAFVKARELPPLKQPSWQLLALQNRYVAVVGEVASAVIEHEADERKIDHVWLALRAGAFGRVQVALSTCS
ncbi:MAG: hypothetical protein ABI883_05230, partial [Chthoniobacterales bacterium]